MKAVLITYKAGELNKTAASKLSKAIFGYKDQSNKSQYTYTRKGIVTTGKNLIISPSTFIVPKSRAEEILTQIHNKGGKATSWEIEINKAYLKE